MFAKVTKTTEASTRVQRVLPPTENKKIKIRSAKALYM